VPLEAEEGEHLTTRLTDEAIAGLDRLEPPFLMHLAYYTVHTPLQAAPERVAERMEAGVKGKRHATYAAMVEGLDAEFGRLMAALEERGLKESTLVLFTSDNGGQGSVTNTQPLRGFKGTLDEGGIRVPWMVRLPGRITPRVDETPVHHADLLPTLAGIAGVDPEASVVDGADLGGLWFEGRPLAERALLWHFPVYLEGRSDRFPTWRTTPGCALRLGDTKLVEYFEDRLDGARRLELYDLDADPRESKDRADEDEERVKEMRDALDAALRRAGAKVPVTPAPQPESKAESKRGASSKGR
ncbi:MAG: sulfatase-like hydrolase/transferase, partial [Planctomycetota bacterium]|nr:sulfatase-like hydrolase/transferase [Planctomycetota bacterium]